jgi:hypothetical protein
VHRVSCLWIVVLSACSPAPGDGSASGQGAGTSGQGQGASGQGGSGSTTSGSASSGAAESGAGGQSSGTGSAAGTVDASAMVPVTDASGPLSDASPPHYGDGSVVAVAATPPAKWVNVTANLAGMPSECGNTPYITSHPAYDMIITSVAQHGLWASTDGGTSWKQLWPTAGANQITNRGSQIFFDPAHPETWWESGIYNGPGVYRTIDNGATFTALGDSHHIDSVSVDLTPCA